jgi:hypothetical protein
MQSLTIPQKDFGYAEGFNVQFSNATAVDLSTYTVNLKMWPPGNPGNVLLNKACSVANASGGSVTYTIASGDFNTVGIYDAELELLTSNTVVTSTETFKLIIAESA